MSGPEAGETRRRALVVGAAVAAVVLLAGALLVLRGRSDDAGAVEVDQAPVLGAERDTVTTVGPPTATGPTPGDDVPGTEPAGSPITAPPGGAGGPTTTRRPAPMTTPSTRANPPAARIPRVAVVGDSTAERLAPAVANWGTQSGLLVGVGNGARIGCPIGRGGEMHTAADVTGEVSPLCDWATASAPGADGTDRPSYPDLVTAWKPDLVVVEAGPWDAADRRLPGDTDWRALGDPVLDAWLLAEMTAATDLLSAGGARVVWLTQPPWEGATRHPPPTLYAPAADPARMQRYNELLHELAARRPTTVRVVDLAGWIAGTDEDARLRPDGAHFEPATAVEVMRRYLGPQLVAAAP